MRNNMDEINRIANHEVNIKRDIGPYDETMTRNMLLAEVAAILSDYVKKDEGDPENGVPASLSIHFVSLDPENYGDLKETEWMYKDLTDETEDNAQLDETEE
jgi:hypothetical protein